MVLVVYVTGPRCFEFKPNSDEIFMCINVITSGNGLKKTSHDGFLYCPCDVWRTVIYPCLSENIYILIKINK